MDQQDKSAETLSAATMYCNYMEDIKARIVRINRIIVDGHSPMKNEAWDGEIAFFFLRKCLEQLVFSWLIANKDAYSQAHTNFAEHWKIESLISRISALNPNFYPKPSRAPAAVDVRGVKNLEIVDQGFLLIDELIDLYNKCSNVIHTWNPYTPRPWVVNTGRPLADWVNRLQVLLDQHYISLLDGSIWFVQMCHPEDGKVHAFPCQPISTHDSRA